MSDLGSTTIYIPENLRPSRNSSYAAFLNENYFTALKTGKQENSGLLQGPRRVLRLCLFGLVLPTIFIIIPLYVRLVLYPPGHYPMMPTDQRVLSRHVSSIWCQAQTTHMNGSFTTYQAPDTPSLSTERRRYEMIHSTLLKDDIKEYWGFHLLKGSRVTVSTCSSRDGAQLMILRGIENLRRCSWIGEQDSVEEEEEEEANGRGGSGEENWKNNPKIIVSTSAAPGEMGNGDPSTPDFQITQLPQNISLEILEYENDSEERRQNLQQLLQKAMKMSKSKKEILRILHSVGKSKSKPIPKTIRKIMGVTSDELNASPESESPVDKKKANRQKNATISSSERAKKRLTRSVEEDIEDIDGAFEVFDDDEEEENGDTPGRVKPGDKKVPNSLEGTLGNHIFYPEGLKFERGKFNQTNKNDKSDEEDESSYSSSEEALAACEGVILTLPLVSYRSCSYRWMEMNKITYDIPITGTYYFVYSSDNEIDSNTIYLNMTFEKVIYDVDQTEVVCSNATDCSVPLSFWSKEKVVVEVPVEGTWDHSYTLDTACEPRVAVYLTFLLLVPVLILFCAFQ